MEFDKPDKEVQRPRGNDVADQARSRLCGWRAEFCEASSVAAAVSAAEEHARESLHATRVPPQRCLKWQLQIRRFEHCAASKSFSLGSGCSPLSSGDYQHVAFRIGCSRVIS